MKVTVRQELKFNESREDKIENGVEEGKEEKDQRQF